MRVKRQVSQQYSKKQVIYDRFYYQADSTSMCLKGTCALNTS